MTPDPPRFLKITPDPAEVANKIGFLSEWTNGYCLGTGCLIALSPGRSFLLGDRRAAEGHGKMYLCRRNAPTPEKVTACELDLYGLLVETDNPNLYIGLYGKGQAQAQYEAVWLEIAATLTLR